MRIYHFDRETGELLGAQDAPALPGREGLPDSDASKWQVPAHATAAAPPVPVQGTVARWTGNAWELAPDHRGKVGWKSHLEQEVIEVIGDPGGFDHPISLTQPPPTPEESITIRSREAQAVKAEAQRRIAALVGTTDLQSCIIKQLNMLMRANELNDKRARGEALTAGEEAEAANLRAFAASIEAIRARSNELEALNPIPADYASDARWRR